MKRRLAYIQETGGGESYGGLPAPEVYVVRIFKTRRAAMAARGCDVVRTWYDYAVGKIRHQLWLRCRGECELCASVVTEKNGHMHEQKHRGKGGEISMANSVFICPTCHRRAHADRNPRFSSSKPIEKGGFVTQNIKEVEDGTAV